MQILRPGGANDTEKWTQFTAGRYAKRARRSSAGLLFFIKTKLNQLNQLLIFLGGFLLSVLPIRRTILTRMQGRPLLFHPLAVKTRRAK